MTTNEDIPSLTLRVLEKIQLELVGLRGDVNGVKGELVGIKGFDHFLGFAGKDVQDLKVRVTTVEQHLGLTPTR